MVQTGDPTGTGKGGQSIWEEYFPVVSFSSTDTSIHCLFYLG